MITVINASAAVTQLEQRPEKIFSFTKLLTVSEVGLKFLKFATNLAISLRSCQSNRDREFHAKLRWEVIKVIAREVRA